MSSRVGEIGLLASLLLAARLTLSAVALAVIGAVCWACYVLAGWCARAGDWLTERSIKSA